MGAVGRTGGGEGCGRQLLLQPLKSDPLLPCEVDGLPFPPFCNIGVLFRFIYHQEA